MRGATLTATGTASRVTLVLRQIRPGTICPADLAIGTAAVTLRAPLAGRSLADGSTGRPIRYFDGRRLLRVTCLPPGYRFSAYLPNPSPPTFTAWEREFTSSRQGDAPVDVEQVPGHVTVPPSWPAASRITVDGRPATAGVLTGNGQVSGRAISWQADGYTFIVYTVLVRDGQHLLPVAELRSIAAGLQA